MRWILRLLSLLIVLVALGFAALYLLPSDRIAEVAGRQVSAALGREVRLSGDVRPVLWPRLGVRTGEITVAGAPGDEPMLSAEALTVEVDWAGLATGDVRVRGVELVAPRLVIASAASNAGDTGSGRSTGAGGGVSTPALTLDRAVITRGTIVWKDPSTGQRFEATDVEAEARLPDWSGTGSLSLTARVQGQPVAFETTVAGVSTFLWRGAVPVSASVELGGAQVQFEGRGSLAPPAMEGRISADLSRRDAIFAVLGQPATDIPQGMGRERLLLTGQVTATDGRLAIRDGTLEADGNRLTFDLDAAPGSERPTLNASVRTGVLDLGQTSSAPGSVPAGAGPSDTGGWSVEPIDASGLSALDGKISFEAQGLRFGGLSLGRIRTDTVIDAGRAVTDVHELAGYGGNVTGTLVVNARSGLSARADLAAEDLSLGPLLADVADQDRLQTTANGSVGLLVTGNTVQAMMSSMSGQGSFRLGAGEYLGLDLVGMLRTLDPGYRGEGARTVFDSVTASFSVADGVLRNDDLAFTAPLLTASGRGTVDLGRKRLDYRIEPAVYTGGGAAEGFRVPVTIRGNWASPSISLDLEAIAEQQLGVTTEEVREEVRDRVEDRIGQKLGVDRQSGESLEDAARRTLKEEAGRELRKLFGGN